MPGEEAGCLLEDLDGWGGELKPWEQTGAREPHRGAAAPRDAAGEQQENPGITAGDGLEGLWTPLGSTAVRDMEDHRPPVWGGEANNVGWWDQDSPATSQPGPREVVLRGPTEAGYRASACSHAY